MWSRVLVLDACAGWWGGGCGSRVWLRQQGENRSVSQVHFPQVSVVSHTSHTAVRVCIRSVTKARQLPEFQQEERDNGDQRVSGDGEETQDLGARRCCHKLLYGLEFGECFSLTHIYCKRL